MPRIPLIDPENLTPDQRVVYAAVVSGPRGKIQGPLLAVLHRPELADKWQQLGELLRYRTSFAASLSEIAILATAQRWRCDLEWHLHEGHAMRARITRSVIEDIRAGRRPRGANAEALDVYDFAIELHDKRTVSAATYDKALRSFGLTGVVELTALVGYYTMVAMTLNAHDFDLPAGVAPVFEEAAVS